MTDSWLITGAAGFIGNHFSNYLFTKPGARQLVLVDKLTYASNLSALDAIAKSSTCEIIHADICDGKNIKNIIKRFNINKIIHFAAETHVDNSIDGPKNFLQANIIGTFELLEAARQCWHFTKDKLFVHVSTDEVFGDHDGHSAPFTEVAQYLPSSPYSASKAASDHLVQAWGRTYKLPVIITHCSNNYGYYQNEEKLIPKVIKNAVKYKTIPIYGLGTQSRDWLHVDDHCQALYMIAKNGSIGESYNISSGEEWKNIDLVNTICDIVDTQLSRPPGTGRKFIEFVDDRKGHDVKYSISADKLQTQLNWSPSKTLSTELYKLVNWYLHFWKLADAS